VPKGLPTDASRRLAIRQPLHSWDYKDFTGTIGLGYGSGTVKNTPGHLVFTRGESRDPVVYSMRETRNGSWLVSVERRGQPMSIKAYSKEHFKSVPMEKLPDLLDQGAEVSPKIDGAGALALLDKGGVRLFGIRPTREGDKPEYTDYVPGLRSQKVPENLRGTVLRGELYGVRNGRAIPPQELSGMLNSTVMNARRRAAADGIRLMLAALAVNRGGDDYSQDKVSDVVGRLGSPSVHALPRYAGKDAMRLAEAMRNGKDRLTSEGVVAHLPGRRPVKLKFSDDADVVVRNIFPADSRDSRAGGFEYSLPDSDRTVGRVGTGFSHELLKDMMHNPEKYTGRTARIRAQSQYPSGAYRAPVFVSMKED